jgi:Flp pilus assembly protein CpaB
MRWPSFRRTLPMSSKVLFGIAGALSLVSFLVVRGEVARADQALRAAGPMAAVVVAAHDLDAGAAIGPADLRLAEIPAVYVPPAALTSIEAGVGLVSAAPVRGGEVLVSTRLSASGFGVSVGFGHVAVTVGFASLPDGLSAADRVDAYATYAGARPYTTLVGEDLHILSIGEAETGFEGSAPTQVTLDVDPETARQLLQAAAAGSLGLAARAAVTPSPSPSASPTPGAWEPPG